MTDNSQLTYITYLVRLWRSDETIPWRASLQDPHSGDKHNFASLSQMMEFLVAQAHVGLSESANTSIAITDANSNEEHHEIEIR